MLLFNEPYYCKPVVDIYSKDLLNQCILLSVLYVDVYLFQTAINYPILTVHVNTLFVPNDI